MHDAYTISSILQQNLIQSIAGYATKLIIGTKIGQLYMYCIPSDETIQKPHLYTYFETAEKKSIRQMKVVLEENLLFVLTNGMIKVFYIGGLHFVLIHSCVETKGCNIFAVDVKVTRSQSGETDIMIHLCVSTKRILKFFIWKSERLQALANEIKLKDDPKALRLVDNIICIGFKDEYVAYNIFTKIPEKHDLSVTSSSKKKHPCICLIKKSIFGITKDDFLIFIDPNTFANQFLGTNKLESIMWGRPLLDLVWDEPYLIGRTDNGFEVRVLDDLGPAKHTLVQSISNFKDVKFLARSDNGGIFAASETEVWYLKMVDIKLQRDILLTQKKFKLAIELTNLSRESEKYKMEIIRGIRVLYARDLFMDKKFARAFDEFLKAETNPYDVILLFPASIKGEFVTVESTSQPHIPMLEDKDLEDATLALIDYLIVARQKDIYLNSKILSIMDTTLLKCYLQTNDSLVAPLLRRKHCNFLESEKTLKKHQKLNELIILYQVFEDHVKALTLLKEQASIEGSSLYGHKRTVKYLQDLNKEHKDLVFEYSKWVLENHPEDGLEIFNENNCEAENNSIPIDEILDFLSKTCERLILPYLEHIVHFSNDSSKIMQEELIMAYVKQIKKLVVSRNLPDVELKQLELYRSKLFETLEKSDKCCPERILQILPPDHFFKERIQVLERTKDHEKILVTYIQVLGDIENALKYCEKVDDNDIFEMLLKILLNPLQTTPYKGVKLQSDFLEPNLEVIIALLNKYPSKMQPARVLSILPGNIRVHRIKNYMETVCRMNTKNKWHNGMLKAFLNAELLRLNEEILTYRKKNCISLTEASICKKCQKHFNNEQILVRNINGDVVHLACFKQSVDGV